VSCQRCQLTPSARQQEGEGENLFASHPLKLLAGRGEVVALQATHPIHEKGLRLLSHKCYEAHTPTHFSPLSFPLDIKGPEMIETGGVYQIISKEAVKLTLYSSTTRPIDYTLCSAVYKTFGILVYCI
jgi:hypothetical protein